MGQMLDYPRFAKIKENIKRLVDSGMEDQIPDYLAEREKMTEDEAYKGLEEFNTQGLYENKPERSFATTILNAKPVIETPTLTGTEGREVTPPEVSPLSPDEVIKQAYQSKLAPVEQALEEQRKQDYQSGELRAIEESNQPDWVKGTQRLARGAMAGSFPGSMDTTGALGNLGVMAGFLNPKGMFGLMNRAIPLASNIPMKMAREGSIFGAYEAMTPPDTPETPADYALRIAGSTAFGAPFGLLAKTPKPLMPWEMRGGEFIRKIPPPVPVGSLGYEDWLASNVFEGIIKHKQIVQDALSRGEKVPQAVLDDYGFGLLDALTGTPKTPPPKFAGSINLEKYPEEARGRIVDAAEKAGLMVRPIVGEKEIRQMAEDMANTGQKATLLEKIAAGRRGKLAAEIKMEQNKLADMILRLHSQTSELMPGATLLSRGAEEAGRTLGSLAWPPNRARLMANLIDGNIKNATANEAAQWIELKKLLFGERAKNPGLMDKLVEWATAIKLTNPFTHMRNIIGNTYSSIMAPLEKGMTGIYNLFESYLTRKPQQRFAREALADVVGRIVGLKGGVGRALRAFTGFDELANINWVRDLKMANIGQRIEAQAGKSIMESGKAAEVGRPAIGGLRGYIVRTPFRALGAMDEFFRGVAHNGESYSLAEREALNKGLRGMSKAEFVEKRANQIMKQVEASIRAGREPGAAEKGLKSQAVYSSSEMKPWEQVRLLASEQLYQSELRGAFGHFNKFRDDVPFTKLIIPFFKTPVNLAKYQFQRSPFGLLSPRNWSDLIKSSGSRAEALARLTVGTIMTSAAVVAAADGFITGSGPKDKNKRDLLYATGWQPYSFRLFFDNKDHWVSMRGFEPITGYFSTVADMVEKTKEKGIAPKPEDFGNAAYVASMNIINQPFMMGARAALDATVDSNKAKQFFDQTVVGMVTPTLTRYMTKIMQPGLKRTDTTASRVVAGLPYDSELPPRLNILGEEIQLDANPLFRALGISTVRNYHLAEELARLDVVPSMPGKNVIIKNRRMELTQDEIDSFLRKRGEIIKMALGKVVNSPNYEMLDDQTKKMALEKGLRKIGVPLARWKKGPAGNPNRLEVPELILSPYIKEETEPYVE